MLRVRVTSFAASFWLCLAVACGAPDDGALPAGPGDSTPRGTPFGGGDPGPSAGDPLPPSGDPTSTPSDPGGPTPGDSATTDETVDPTVAGEPFAIQGFGAATVGGYRNDATTVSVTSLSDDGPGSLRDALRNDHAPRLITFAVDGRIELTAPLIVLSNVSIDGRGRDVGVRGKGFVIPGSDQVILTNLVIEDVGPDSEDGVQIGSPTDPSEHIVLDHLSFLQEGDGGDSANVDEAVSIVFGSRKITLAHCRFERWEKVILAGNGDAEASLDALITLTAHHNAFLDTGRRHPQARHGQFDFYANVLEDWHMYDWFFLEPYRESFGAQIQDDGQLRFENNMVSRAPGTYDTASSANEVSRCESGGKLFEAGTWVAPESTAPLQFGVGCAAANVFARPYAVTLPTAGGATRASVLAEAGATLR